MDDAWVNWGAERNRLPIRINGSNPTFEVDVARIERNLLAPLDDVLLDMIDVACVVFAADSAVRRGGSTRAELGTAWDRRFEFRIPVRNPHLWRKPEVHSVLEHTVSFLTDDTVSFVFTQAKAVRRQEFLPFDPEAATFKADEVILFSGGLDSFSGTLEALSTRKGNVILVTHRSAQKAIPRQEELGRIIKDKFAGRVLHIHVKAHNKSQAGKETTQRSRSLLFAALGQTVAHAFGAKHVNFYENGIISHNLPINEAVVGTMATRTTHPLSLTLLNGLMEAIDPQCVPIRNPYEWLTKAEVIQRGLAHGSKPHLRHSVSCTSLREQDRLHTHCGCCSQCLDRRFAILSLGIADADPAEMYKVDVLTGPREGELSKTMAADWTRHAISLRDKPERQFATEFASSFADIVRGLPGVPASQTFARTFEMHRRHGETVVGVLRRAIADHADALASGSLPPTSLLVTHISRNGHQQQDPRNRRAPTPTSLLRPEDEKDLVLDANAALEVSFRRSEEMALVTVHGIGEVAGRPAAVAHALRPRFDEDRKAGKLRKKYRYTETAALAHEMSISKDAINQAVGRCRKTLRENFVQIHGSPPAKHLLIESGNKPSGYRLDPDIRIVAVK